MLDQLDAACQNMIGLENASGDDARRLTGIVEDLRWYAGRIGMERWNSMPRSNKWSFEQNLWRLTRQARTALAPVPDRIRFFIDRGNQCVGLAGEIFALFEYADSEQ